MVRISDIQNNIVLWDTVPYCEIAESDIGTYLFKPMIFYLQEQEGLLGSRILYKKFLKKQSTQDT